MTENDFRDTQVGETNETDEALKSLSRCTECGKYKGVVDSSGKITEVKCLCDGVLCSRCGVNNAYRPMTHMYSEQEHGILWVSSMSGRLCSECRKQDGLVLSKLLGQD